MSMRIADGLMNFKCRLHFYISIWFICAVYCKTWSALHAIRGFRMQRDPKGNRLPFATAHKDISVPFASCRKVSDSRMQNICFFADFFRFCMRYLTPFGFLPKGGRLPLELKQKGIKCTALPRVKVSSNPRRIHSEEEDEEKEERGLVV